MVFLLAGQPIILKAMQMVPFAGSATATTLFLLAMASCSQQRVYQRLLDVLNESRRWRRIRVLNV
jgi:hypothetical protein